MLSSACRDGLYRPDDRGNGYILGFNYGAVRRGKWTRSPSC